ncbi:hypothetical protein BJV82DRAFT_713828 [Fennellomyces sp. T-0311]|nr:hypothetical protein BJV82DRAFT_713828 [Fennellomyces sp. T-0311]
MTKLGKDFLNRYPFEIIKHVFSFIDQPDCLECMRVCRQWSKEIPLYTTDIWKHVRLDSYQNLNHGRVMKCLGPHVEKLDLRQCQDEQINAFIYSLEAVGCNNIKELEIHECSQTHKNPHIAVDALLQIGSNLRELTLHVWEEDYMDPHYLQLLASCPTITHFSYLNFTSSSSRTGDEEPYQVPELPQLGLKYLYINAAWHEYKDKYLMALLRSSPHLKCLLVADLDYEEPNFMEWYTERWPTGYLRKYLDACPNLQYFAWNTWFDEEVEHWKSRATVDSERNGLLELVMRNVDNFFLKRFIQTMTKSLDTLEVFAIQADYPGYLDWSPFASTCPDQLATLELSLIEMDGQILGKMIRHAPALETVRLEIVESLFTDEVLESLALLRKLRSLGFVNTFSQENTSQTCSLCQSVYRFLEADCRQLQNLELHGTLMVSNYLLQAVSNITTLRKLNLSWRGCPPLDGLAHLLQAIPLESIELEQIYMHDDIVEAVNILLMHQQDTIRGLSLVNCYVDDAMLKTIADCQLPKLETITICTSAVLSDKMIQYATCKFGRRVRVNFYS